jgi:hypothetical protein
VGPRAGQDVWSRENLFPENGQLNISAFTLNLVKVYGMNFVVLSGEIITPRIW